LVIHHEHAARADEQVVGQWGLVSWVGWCWQGCPSVSFQPGGGRGELVWPPIAGPPARDRAAAMIPDQQDHDDRHRDEHCPQPGKHKVEDQTGGATGEGGQQPPVRC
jgi:hypothetical protein